MIKRFIVSVIDSNGMGDFYEVKLKGHSRKSPSNMFDIIRDNAENAGYEVKFIYDETDRGFKTIEKCFDWNTAITIE